MRPIAHIFCAGIVTLFASLLSPSGQASEAGETDADFQVYCSQSFPGSEHDRVGFTHYCRQGPPGRSATRENIDLAEACRLTTGSAAFRRVGHRVVCTGEDLAGQAQSVLGPPEFQAYCRENTANGGYEKRAERWGIVHYCRLPGANGGFTLQQIDLSDACMVTSGSGHYDDSSGRIICVGNQDSVASGNLDNPEGRSTSPGRDLGAPRTEKPPIPRPLPFPPPSSLSPSESQSAGLPGNSDDPADLIARACSVFGGQWRAGTIAMAEQIVAETKENLTREISEIAALPWPREWIESHQQIKRTENFVSGYFRITLIWQCHAVYLKAPELAEPGTIAIARKEACAVSEILDQLLFQANAQGVSVLDKERGSLLERLEIEDVCDAPTTKLFRRTPNGTEEVGDAIESYGGPFFVEASYPIVPFNPDRQLSLSELSGLVLVKEYEGTHLHVERKEGSDYTFISEDFFLELK